MTTLLMSGSDLLEHMVCSSLIKSVSSSENTDRPTGSLGGGEMNNVHFELKYQFMVMKSFQQETNLWSLPLAVKRTSVLDFEPATKRNVYLKKKRKLKPMLGMNGLIHYSYFKLKLDICRITDADSVPILPFYAREQRPLVVCSKRSGKPPLHQTPAYQRCHGNCPTFPEGTAAAPLQCGSSLLPRAGVGPSQLGAVAPSPATSAAASFVGADARQREVSTAELQQVSVHFCPRQTTEIRHVV